MNLDLGMALDISKSSAWVKADSGSGAVPPVPCDPSLHVQLLCTGGLAFLPGGRAQLARSAQKCLNPQPTTAGVWEYGGIHSSPLFLCQGGSCSPLAVLEMISGVIEVLWFRQR